MFIIISIYSKNLNSLTNFLKFFYKLKKNPTFKLKFYSTQAQKKRAFSFFSALQSPHVNKKSQEQFEYYMHHKKLKIHVSQITKFLAIWKIAKMTLFSDIKLETVFWLNNKPSNFVLLSKINYDKYKPIPFLCKKLFLYKNSTRRTKKNTKSFYDTQCVLSKGIATMKASRMVSLKPIKYRTSSSTTTNISLNFLDARGEILLKSVYVK